MKISKFYQIAIAPFRVLAMISLMKSTNKDKQNKLKEFAFFKSPIQSVNEIRFLLLLELGESRYVFENIREVKKTKTYLSYYIEAYSRKKQGHINIKTRILFKKSVVNSPRVFRNFFAFRYIEYLREEGIPNTEQLGNCEKLILKSYVPYKSRHSKFCMEFASAAIEKKQYNTAIYWFRKNPNNIKILDNYLPLKLFLLNQNHIKNKRQEDLQILKNIIHPTTTLGDILIKNKNSFCIVGNSPITMGKKMGNKIDSYDLVIRFNNFSTSKEYTEDIGSKTDIWVRMLPTTMITQKPNKGMKLIMFTGANSLNRSISKHRELFKLSKEGYNIDFFDKNIFFELQQIIGAPPSSGLMICYTIFKIFGKIQSDDVYGLSMGEDFIQHKSYHYSDKEAKPTDRHHWVKERDVFEKMGLC